jgi:hypothetical protein
MKDMLSNLRAFLMNQTDELEFLITDADLSEVSKEDAASIDSIIKHEASLAGASGFTVSHASGSITIVKHPKMTSRDGDSSRNMYKDGEPDARLSEAPVSNNPFRPRYRKLADVELELHDAVKMHAMELLDTFRKIPEVRQAAGQENSGEVHASLKLAQRHLEDAVYRAAKALTT